MLIVVVVGPVAADSVVSNVVRACTDRQIAAVINGRLPGSVANFSNNSVHRGAPI